jgi:hypothetical protein
MEISRVSAYLFFFLNIRFQRTSPVTPMAPGTASPALLQGRVDSGTGSGWVGLGIWEPATAPGGCPRQRRVAMWLPCCPPAIAAEEKRWWEKAMSAVVTARVP